MSKLMEWVDARLPISDMIKSQATEYPTPKKSELLVELRFPGAVHFNCYDRHWSLFGHALQTRRKNCV